MTTAPDKPDGISSGEPLVQGRPGSAQAPPQGEFDSLMQGSESMQKGMTTPPPGLSPAEVPQNTQIAQQATPSIDSVLNQVGATQDSLGNLQNQLNTKNLRLNNSQKSLLKSKLSNSTTHLRAVNEQLGIEPPPPPQMSKTGPVAKFLSYVTDGQNQMDAAQAQLMQLQNDKTQMNQGTLLLMQVKMNQAQQELDYSSMILSKAVTALTQLLNTQL